MRKGDDRKSNATSQHKLNARVQRGSMTQRCFPTYDYCNYLESADPAKGHRRHEQDDTMDNIIESITLQECGYYFSINGRLVSFQTGKPFEYDYYRNAEDNQIRYHAIGRLVTNHIYDLLESVCNLSRIEVPIDHASTEPTGFIFASKDVRECEYLMIIIHGTGAVRAGQWSRKLIMNESLEVGSQIDYINRARNIGYGVIVTNTNLNIDEYSSSVHNKPRLIRGSESAENHGCYVWENFVRNSRARYICIMAHSYGGAVVLELATQYTSEFDKRVFAVALTDSPMKSYTKNTASNILKMLQKRTVNWIVDKAVVDTKLHLREYGETRSAGHDLHEWTSYTAFNAIFKYFDGKRKLLGNH